MQAIVSGKLNLMVYMLFPILLLCSLLVRKIVGNIRSELDMAKYEMERGPIEEAPQPPPKELLLPGYTMLTQVDYDEVRAKVEAELKDRNIDAE